MNLEYSSLFAEVVACRNIVDDYADRIDKACMEYYETRRTDFPNLSRAENEDVHQQCSLVLSRLTYIMPDVLQRWQSIKFPINEYDDVMIVQMRDFWIRRRNFFRTVENNLRTMLELENISERNRIEATKSQNIYNIGSIINSNVNIASTLSQVTQQIDAAPNFDEAGKRQLAELIEQLKAELQKLPPTKSEEAEALAESAKALVDAGTKSPPNKTTVQITAEGLKKAAENIAGVMPTVVSIAASIVKSVFLLAGVPLPKDV